MRSSSKRRRAPKPTVSPVVSRIGQTSRPRKRSYSPRLPRPDSPPVTISSSVKPRSRRCRLSASPPWGAKPMPNCLGGGAVEAALAQEVAPGPGLGPPGVEEQRGVELLGHPVRLDQPRALAERHAALAGAATLLVAQLEAELGGEPLDGLGEGEVLDLLHERDDVAALAAAEAVVAADGRAHGEARGLLVVEGAQALERAHPGRAQGHVVAHDVLDGRALLDRRDVLGHDPTRH